MSITPEELDAVIEKINNGASLASQARELNVSDQTLRNWIKKVEADNETEEDITMETPKVLVVTPPNGGVVAGIAPKSNPVNPVDLFRIVRKANNEEIIAPKGKKKKLLQAAN